MSQRIKVEPAVLVWARERSGLTLSDLLEDFPHYSTWESGDGRPTLRQLEELAGKTRTPLGCFFLDSPPEDKLPIADFRTKQGEQPRRPGPDLLDTLTTMQQRQAWLSEQLKEGDAAPVAFVGSVTIHTPVEEAALRMRELLGVDLRWARQQTSVDGALRTLRNAIEAAGVIVSISGVVGLNNRRVLKVDEFRGFALVDSHAPLIFVNGSDAKSAQMFTLAHELAHLFLGLEGVSNPSADADEGSQAAERFCNRVAAEFLVPASELRSLWPASGGDAETFKRLASGFRVSPVVVARRAMELKLIRREAFFTFHREYQEELDALGERRKKSSGGNFYATVEVRLGHRFASAVFRAAKSGRLLYRDAYQLTGLHGATFERLSKSYALGYQA